jgi:hypothetical protein
MISILTRIAEIDGLQAGMLPDPQYNCRWSFGAYNNLQVLHRTYSLLENFSTTFGEIYSYQSALSPTSLTYHDQLRSTSLAEFV